ncbi:unnamed protein product [Spirodela intermedia]|uniref:HIT-type domain-containing protein n=1 Tax=Spirodela intermedia TaxID=51605 RepID=A0A7I8IRM6_SPIIN|nr:unnamed protein product [Spirodela intermedia]CAA6660623.1 unnamed protein product [Spirodela intermedia]
MEDDVPGGPLRRMSSRIRRVAPKMVAALASSDNREQAALARLEALESDNAFAEVMEVSSEEDDSLDGDGQAHMQRRQSKNMKRKTRQGKAMENAKRAPRTFIEILHDANLEALPRHVPTYLRAPYFCAVCGFAACYTCVRCGARFCSCRCQVIHNETRCLKFIS